LLEPLARADPRSGAIGRRLSACPAPADTIEVPARRFAILLLLLVIDACATTGPTACDGFADRKLAISSAEYRGCAGEILAALDAIEPPLGAVVSGEGE